MLTPYLDAGPFTRSEFDELLAPWRAVVENCPRSRLAVQIMTGWIGPASALWATADAVLAERSASD